MEVLAFFVVFGSIALFVWCVFETPLRDLWKWIEKGQPKAEPPVQVQQPKAPVPVQVQQPKAPEFIPPAGFTLDPHWYARAPSHEEQRLPVAQANQPSQPSPEATAVSISAPEEARHGKGDSAAPGGPPIPRTARKRAARKTPPPPPEGEFPELFDEGTVRQVSLSAYERDPRARRACLAHHGMKCAVCGFDFAEKYGELGEGYIHVHHLRPLSQINARYQVNPITDLIPVDPNCHAMLHRQTPPLSPEALRRLLLSEKNQNRGGETATAKRRKTQSPEKAAPKPKRTAVKKPKAALDGQ